MQNVQSLKNDMTKRVTVYKDVHGVDGVDPNKNWRES